MSGNAGTAALTLDRPIPPNTAARPKTPVAARPAVRTGARVAERPAMKLSFKTVALFAAAVSMLLVIVYSYMQLSQLNRTYQENSLTLQSLKKEERMLTRQAEAGVSLSEVEAYAVGELGMVKPTKDQIVYISLAGEDHAEIIPVKGFWGSVKQIFSTMTMKAVEFFE